MARKAVESHFTIPEVAEEIAKISQTLSHKARVMILASISSGRLSLSEIGRQTGYSFQALQQHVKELVDKGLIQKGENKGEYKLTENGEHIISVIEHLTVIPSVRNIVEAKKKEEVELKVKKLQQTFRELKPYTEELGDYDSPFDVKKLKELLRSVK